MADDSAPALDELVAAVRASSRYHDVAEPLVRRVAERELAKKRSLKEAVKATRSKLHQVAGAYIEEPRYTAWMADLRGAWGEACGAPDADALRRAALRRVMARHTSTRERLPILDEFYARTLASLGPIHSVLDIACGLNPLALSWAPLADEVDYYAYDIYAEMMGFLGDYFALESAADRPGLRGYAELRDVIAAPPDQRADLALILKAIPCLEQVDKTAGERLLRGLRADHLLISFPVHSLGGRNKGMLTTYEARFYELMAQTGLGAVSEIKRFEFATELAFLVSR